MKCALFSVFFLLLTSHLFVPNLAAQQSTGILRGTVTDPSGASIPGAVVTAVEAGGQKRSVTTGDNGNYLFRGLQPGSWTVDVTAPGLVQPGTRTISIQPANNTLNFQMVVAAGYQEVTVSDTTEPEVRLDPTQSASAQVMHSEDLGSLADDPDDLLTDLQALAGPSAGLNGGQIFIDGFTAGDGTLPNKDAICCHLWIPTSPPETGRNSRCSWRIRGRDGGSRRTGGTARLTSRYRRPRPPP